MMLALSRSIVCGLRTPRLRIADKWVVTHCLGIPSAVSQVVVALSRGIVRGVRTLRLRIADNW